MGPKKDDKEERLGAWALGKFSSRLKVKTPAASLPRAGSPKTQPATRRGLVELARWVADSRRRAVQSGCYSEHLAISTFWRPILHLHPALFVLRE
jgi:hypothetical protein